MQMNLFSEKTTLLTIGHSTRPLDDFLALLGEFKTEVLVDIRRFPGSQRFPHFNREALERALPEAGIEYVWLEDLGGRRNTPKIYKSTNPGLKHPAFRNYADYMQTDQFQAAVSRLLSIASTKTTAIMCAEKLFWKCHRHLLSDYLTAHNVLVEHIMDHGHLQPHKLSEGAIVSADLRVTYPLAVPDTPTLFDR
jgi:uncharacterized protein (DUF488 family)